MTAMRYVLGAVLVGAIWFVTSVVRDDATDDSPSRNEVLRVGMCLASMPEARFSSVDDVDCSKRHIAEVYGTGAYSSLLADPADAAPFETVPPDELDAAVHSKCVDEQTDRRRRQLIEVGAQLSFFVESRIAVKSYFCVAVFDERTGTLAEATA